MTKRNIGEEILQGLQEISSWKHGGARLKSTIIHMPTAEDVPHIRKKLGLTQQAFAAFMGVSIGTLRNWEQGRREPHGSAKALLLIADKQPHAFREAFKFARKSKKAA